MLPEPHLHVLKQIVASLRDVSFPWVVTGSVGMALQGLPVAVHDIDLQTDRAGAYQIERIWQSHVVQAVRYVESARIRSHLGMLQIDGITVEIMGEMQKRLEDDAWEEPVQLETYRHWVSVANMRVPVLSLAYEYLAYRRMGRVEKAQMLWDWLHGRKGS